MALRKVFTYLGAIFLMSHIICINVFAVEPDLAVNFYAGHSNPYWQTNNNETYHNTAMSVGPSENYAIINKIKFRSSSNTAIGFPVGTYLSVVGTFNSPGLLIDSSGANSYTNQSIGYFGISTETNNCTPVNFDYNQQDYVSNGGYIYKYNFEYICRLTDSGTPTIGFFIRTAVGTPAGAVTLSINRINIYKAVDSVSQTDIINAISRIEDAIDGLADKFDDVVDAINEAQENESAATEDAVADSQEAGNTSSSDAQTGTASLISTIGSAVSAITSASPTNCLLNGDMGNFDMGQIDLCANPVPAFVQIIGSLILILVTVPLCIVLFNRFIGLFRSFQG